MWCTGFGPGSAGEFLTRHPGVDAITFTGETATGEAIMKAAAEGVRPVSLELGGKNPGIVFADCDFEAAVAGIARASFLNTGQVCLGTERVYVERPIFDSFVARAEGQGRGHEARAILRTRRTGIGPLISLEHREKVLRYYQRACRGRRHRGYRRRHSADAGLARRRRLGPADHLDRPVRDSRRGPRGNLWALLPHPALRRRRGSRSASPTTRRTGWRPPFGPGTWAVRFVVGTSITAGIIWINSWFLRDLRTPFGGSKLSGIGREGGVHSLEFYTELRNVCVAT